MLELLKSRKGKDNEKMKAEKFVQHTTDVGLHEVARLSQAY